MAHSLSRATLKQIQRACYSLLTSSNLAVFSLNIYALVRYSACFNGPGPDYRCDPVSQIQSVSVALSTSILLYFIWDLVRCCFYANRGRGPHPTRFAAIGDAICGVVLSVSAGLTHSQYNFCFSYEFQDSDICPPVAALFACSSLSAFLFLVSAAIHVQLPRSEHYTENRVENLVERRIERLVDTSAFHNPERSLSRAPHVDNRAASSTQAVAEESERAIASQRATIAEIEKAVASERTAAIEIEKAAASERTAAIEIEKTVAMQRAVTIDMETSVALQRKAIMDMEKIVVTSQTVARDLDPAKRPTGSPSEADVQSSTAIISALSNVDDEDDEKYAAAWKWSHNLCEDPEDPKKEVPVYLANGKHTFDKVHALSQSCEDNINGQKHSDNGAQDEQEKIRRALPRFNELISQGEKRSQALMDRAFRETAITDGNEDTGGLNEEKRQADAQDVVTQNDDYSLAEADQTATDEPVPSTSTATKSETATATEPERADEHVSGNETDRNVSSGSKLSEPTVTELRTAPAAGSGGTKVSVSGAEADQAVKYDVELLESTTAELSSARTAESERAETSATKAAAEALVSSIPQSSQLSEISAEEHFLEGSSETQRQPSQNGVSAAEVEFGVSPQAEAVPDVKVEIKNLPVTELKEISGGLSSASEHSPGVGTPNAMRASIVEIPSLRQEPPKPEFPPIYNRPDPRSRGVAKSDSTIPQAYAIGSESSFGSSYTASDSERAVEEQMAASADVPPFSNPRFPIASNGEDPPSAWNAITSQACATGSGSSLGYRDTASGSERAVEDQMTAPADVFGFSKPDSLLYPLPQSDCMRSEALRQGQGSVPPRKVVRGAANESGARAQTSGDSSIVNPTDRPRSTPMKDHYSDVSYPMRASRPMWASKSTPSGSTPQHRAQRSHEYNPSTNNTYQGIRDPGPLRDRPWSRRLDRQLYWNQLAVDTWNHDRARYLKVAGWDKDDGTRQKFGTWETDGGSPIAGPGSAEYLSTLLIGPDHSCSHLPKLQPSIEKGVYIPNRLGFFHHSDSSYNEISYIDTTKLCQACYDKAVPQGYLTWSTNYGDADYWNPFIEEMEFPSEYCGPDDNSFPVQVQAGTEGFAKEYLIPGFKHKRRYLERFARLPSELGNLEAWTYLKWRKQPFYIDISHLDPPWRGNSPEKEQKEQSERVVAANGIVYLGAAEIILPTPEGGVGPHTASEYRIGQVGRYRLRPTPPPSQWMQSQNIARAIWDPTARALFISNSKGKETSTDSESQLTDVDTKHTSPSGVPASWGRITVKGLSEQVFNGCVKGKSRAFPFPSKEHVDAIDLKAIGRVLPATAEESQFRAYSDAIHAAYATQELLAGRDPPSEDNLAIGSSPSQSRNDFKERIALRNREVLEARAREGAAQEAGQGDIVVPSTHSEEELSEEEWWTD